MSTDCCKGSVTLLKRKMSNLQEEKPSSDHDGAAPTDHMTTILSSLTGVKLNARWADISESSLATTKAKGRAGENP